MQANKEELEMVEMEFWIWQKHPKERTEPEWMNQPSSWNRGYLRKRREVIHLGDSGLASVFRNEPLNSGLRPILPRFQGSLGRSSCYYYYVSNIFVSVVLISIKTSLMFLYPKKLLTHQLPILIIILMLKSGVCQWELQIGKGCEIFLNIIISCSPGVWIRWF